MKRIYLLKIYLSIIGLCLWSVGSMAQGYSVTTVEQCNSTAAGDEIVTFTSATPNAVGDGTLTIYFRGDFDGGTSGGEYLDFYGETIGGAAIGNTTQSTTGISNTQCNTIYDSVVISIPMADINSWASDGTISITADGASGVSTTCPSLPGSAYCLYMKLEYPRASGLNDIGVASVDAPTVFCAGSQNILVTVQNYGLNQVTSGTVNWTWNGVAQTPLTIAQLIDTAQGTNPNNIQLMLGTKTITNKDTLVVWTSAPNGGVDTTNINDTITVVVAPALSGTFTIGGASPDYTSFGAAIADMNAYGICGPVVLNVASGSGPYNEQVDIPEITGASATNTITINGNGETLTFGGSSSSYPTLNLDGADYITVNDLNIEASGSSNSWALHLMNNADNNSFNNCNFSASMSSTSSTTGCVSMSGSTTSYSSAGNNGSNNTFTNCSTSGGYFGFALYGSSPASGNVGNSIVNSTISDYYYYGIYSLQQSGLTVSGNTVHRPTRTSVSSAYTLYLSTGCENSLVEGNRITNLFGGASTSTSLAYVIYVTGDAMPGSENKIINNLIYDVGGNGTHYGMYLTGDNVKVFHNTIALNTASSTSGTTRGIYSTAAGAEIKNNDIYITRGGTGAKYCLYFTGGSQVCDNNNLYMGAPAGSNNIGYYSGDYATLTGTGGWQSANGGIWDQNSISLDPIYLSPGTGDFTPISAAMDNQGAPVGVSADINGAVRNATTPDIGAFEFSIPACSGTPTPGTLTTTATGNLCFNTVADLSVSGSSIGTGITFQLETAPSSSGPWTPLGTADITPPASVTITGTAYYRVAVSCNGGTPSYTNDIQILMNPLFPAGTYTIDSSTVTGGTNFQSFTEAVSAINCGIAGPIVFNVVAGSGPYIEQITLPSTIGTTAANTVTFNGNGDTLRFDGSSSSYPTLNLDGADYITFNNLVIEASGSSNSWALHLMNDADHNTFNGCTFLASMSSTSSTTGCVSMSGSTTSYSTAGNNGSYNTFSNCTTLGGYFGFALYGSAPASSNVGNSIVNSTISDYYYYGIYNIQQSGLTVSGNTVHRPTRTSVSSAYTLYLSTGCENSLVEGNRITNLFGGTSTSTSLAYVIYVTGDAMPGSENKIINNLIYDVGGNGTHYGMYLTGDNVKVFHNTIALNTASSTSGTTRGIYSTAAGAEIKNNDIYITRGGTGAKHCLYFTGGSQVCDNNNLYMGAPAGNNNIGYYSGDYATLTGTGGWQSANGGIWDQNSKTTDPQYANAMSGDYTPGAFQLDNTGAPVGVTTDITGAARNATTPDMGAYEFSVPFCMGQPNGGDAFIDGSQNVFACLNQPLALTLSNYSTDNGISIQWEESYDGGFTWMPIAGATNASVGVTFMMDAMYHAVLTCINGGQNAASTPVSVFSKTFYDCYCSPLTGVSLQTSSGTNYITNVEIPGTTLNVPTTTAGTDGYLQHDYTVASNTALLTEGQTYSLVATHSSTSTSIHAELWIDWDQSGTFDSLGAYGLEYIPVTVSGTTDTFTFTVPVGVLAGQTGMRLRSLFSTTATFGANGACTSISTARETEDFVISINPAIPCSGIPSTGTMLVAANDSSICNGMGVNLAVTGYPLELGIVYQWESSPAGQNNFTAISGATDFNYTTGSLSADMDYRMAATCTNPGGGTGYSNVLTITVANPQLLTTAGATRCGIGVVSLSATANPGEVVTWYADAAGGTPLDTGNIFSPIVSHDSIFYATAVAGGGGTHTLGANDPTIGTVGAWASTAQWVNFSVYSPTVIQFVDMFWTAAVGSAFSIEIRDATSLANVFTYNGTVTVTNSSATSATNPQTIPLNASLPPGDYQINLGTNPGTVRNSTGGVYPYSIPGVIEITGNTFSTVYYYMFYKWVVSTGCEGSRVPVVVTVTPPPAYTLSATPDTVCAGSSGTISISSANAYTYTWTPTGSGNSFSVTPATHTTYYVSGIDGNNCSIYDSVTIGVRSVEPTTTVADMPAICVSGNAELSLSPVPMSGIDIQWQKDAGSGFADISGATADTLSDPVTANVSYQANFFCNGTLVGTSTPVAISYSNPSVVNTYPGFRCDTGYITLLAEGSTGSTINWYAAATGGSPLGIGNAFTTPSLTSTTTYYAAAVGGGGGVVAGGKPAPVSSATGYSAGTLEYGLVFDALQPFTLVSIDVYSTASAGSLTLILEDNAGTILQSVGPFSIPAGTGTTIATGATPTTIPLNIPIPVGTGYRLYTGNLTATFVRENSGNTYPYPLGTVGNVTTSWTNGTASSANYYFFYDWKVSSGCESPRVPVTATITGAASGNTIATGGTTIVTAQADGTTLDYSDGCNDKVLTITDAPSGNTLGITAATVVTLPAVQTSGTQPYVPRVFDVTPASDGPATVTLYVLQTEFDAYNTYVNSNSLGLPLLPANASDPAASNIVITQYHGLASAGAAGPLGLYDNTSVELIPNSAITASSNGTYWTISFPVTGFSGFFIHTGTTPLAIELVNITATNLGHFNRVDWTTGEEKAGDYFELERSADGSEFTKLAGINGKGRASTYSYKDENPLSGKNYYRLKMYDASGNHKYSKVVWATMNGKGGFQVEAFPNPAADVINVRINGIVGKSATLAITDMAGKQIKTLSVTDNRATIDVSGLAQGVYFLKYADADQTQTIKITKQ